MKILSIVVLGVVLALILNGCWMWYQALNYPMTYTAWKVGRTHLYKCLSIYLLTITVIIGIVFLVYRWKRK